MKTIKDRGMKTILAAALLLLSASVLADKPPCLNNSRANCGYAPPGLSRDVANPDLSRDAANVPSPGTLALVSLGVAGLIIARKKKG
jgi:hypothetical protein